jgi:hypothetical protein
MKLLVLLQITYVCGSVAVDEPTTSAVATRTHLRTSNGARIGGAPINLVLRTPAVSEYRILVGRLPDCIR